MTSLSENVLRAAVGQFPVVEDWEANASVAGRLIDEAERDGVQLLVLPEGIMTRFIDRKEKIREAAQALNGPFVEAMREHSRDKNVTVFLVCMNSQMTHDPLTRSWFCATDK